MALGNAQGVPPIPKAMAPARRGPPRGHRHDSFFYKCMGHVGRLSFNMQYLQQSVTQPATRCLSLLLCPCYWYYWRSVVERLSPGLRQPRALGRIAQLPRPTL